MSRWLVGKSIPTPNGKEYVEIYLHDPYAILLAWCEDEPSLSVTRPTASRLLKLWRLRLGCRSSRFISRLWYKHLLSEARQWERLFPEGSPEYVRALLLLRSTRSRQTQPPKCPQFLNPGRRIWSKTCHVTIYHPSEHFKAAHKSSSHRWIAFLSWTLQYRRSVYTQAFRAATYKYINK